MDLTVRILGQLRSLGCFLVIFSVIGCVQTCESERLRMAPDKVVEEYLDTAFGMTDIAQKDILLSYTTGKLRNALQTATDEKFAEAFLKRKFKLISYACLLYTSPSPRDQRGPRMPSSA